MIGVAFLALTTIAPPAMAQTLKQFEDRLHKRELYVEVTNAEAPAFSLTEADGRTMSLSDFRGKILVLYFVYARCKELCPLQNDLLASIQEQINATPKRDQVQFVTIVTDTEDAQETAKIIRGFPRRHGFDSRNWIVLYRGGLDPYATIKLAEKYGLKFSYTKDGDQLHAVVTYLIDREGVMRARYHGLNFDPANLIAHVNALIEGNR